MDKQKILEQAFACLNETEGRTDAWGLVMRQEADEVAQLILFGEIEQERNA